MSGEGGGKSNELLSIMSNLHPSSSLSAPLTWARDYGTLQQTEEYPSPDLYVTSFVEVIDSRSRFLAGKLPIFSEYHQNILRSVRVSWVKALPPNTLRTDADERCWKCRSSCNVGQYFLRCSLIFDFYSYPLLDLTWAVHNPVVTVVDKLVPDTPIPLRSSLLLAWAPTTTRGRYQFKPRLHHRSSTPKTSTLLISFRSQL